MTRSRFEDRKALVYELRFRARAWWSRGWNQITTVVVLYGVFLSVFIWQIPSILGGS